MLLYCCSTSSEASARDHFHESPDGVREVDDGGSDSIVGVGYVQQVVGWDNNLPNRATMTPTIHSLSLLVIPR